MRFLSHIDKQELTSSILRSLPAFELAKHETYREDKIHFLFPENTPLAKGVEFLVVNPPIYLIGEEYFVVRNLSFSSTRIHGGIDAVLTKTPIEIRLK